MNRIKRYALLAAAVAALSGALLIYGCGDPLAGGPTNVIFITLDTTRADHLGCYGSPEVKTPNLDAFAGGSVRFANCYTAANSTLPSHVSIFSSKYMRDHGIYDNSNTLYDMPDLLWSVLNRSGYYSVAYTSGSTLNSSSNINQQFDEFYRAGDLERPAEDTVDQVIEWLDNKSDTAAKDGGLFMWVHLFDPHVTYAPPPPYHAMYTKTSEVRMDFATEWRMKDVRRYDTYFSLSGDPEFYRNRYKGEISYMDEHIGRLLDRLKKTGIYDNSIIVIVADHGESLGEHSIYWDHKGLYDTCSRVPLMIKPKAPFTPGVREQLVSSVDIYPTVLEALGMDPGRDIAGTSLMGIIGDEHAPEIHDAVYYQSPNEHELGIRTPDYTYIRRIVDGVAGKTARTVLTDPKGKAELYANGPDPDQTANLYRPDDGLSAWFENRAYGFINDLQGRAEPDVITDKKQLERLKSLGYVQ